MPTMSLGKALNSGLRRAMEHDPKVVLMGEDIGKLGGVFRVTEGLQRDFGDRRVIDTPLAESGVIGTAVGLALRGYRPVCEIQFDGFIYPAFDQIVSQVAKMHYRNEGRVTVPLTIRVPFGGGVGAVEHHSESPEAYFAHTAGLRVVTPSNAADGYRMIQQAIASDDPVVFFEPKRRYWEKGDVALEADVDGDASPHRPRSHSAAPRSSGWAATSPSPPTAPWWPPRSTPPASPRRRAPPSRSSTCARSRPIDFATIEASVQKTGRLVVAHEASVFCGLGAEIAARISERCFFSPRGAGAPRRRLRHAVPGLASGTALPPRRRPHPARGGPVPPAMSTRRQFAAARPRRGTDGGRARGLARRRRRRGDAEPGPRSRWRPRRPSSSCPAPSPARSSSSWPQDGATVARRGTAHRHRHRRSTPDGRRSTDARREEKVPMLVGYGPSEAPPSRRAAQRQRAPEPIAAAPATPAATPAANAPPKPLAPPPVRFMARQNGVDLADVTGHGPGGIITREDLAAHLAGGTERSRRALAQARRDARRERPCAASRSTWPRP